MKFSVVLVLLLFTVPFALAEIEDATITIKVYSDFNISSNTTITIEVINSEYTANNRNYTINTINDSAIDKIFNFVFVYLKNESVSMNIVESYIACLDKKANCELQKGQYNTAWDICRRDLDIVTGENSTNYKEELSNCILNIKEKDLDIESKNKEIIILGEEKENTKNSKYFLGFIGVLIGILGILIYRGEIGGEKARDKSEGEWHKGQAG